MYDYKGEQYSDYVGLSQSYINSALKEINEINRRKCDKLGKTMREEIWIDSCGNKHIISDNGTAITTCTFEIGARDIQRRFFAVSDYLEKRREKDKKEEKQANITNLVPFINTSISALV